MTTAFVIDRRDNVATMLAECLGGTSITLRGETSVASVDAAGTIRAEHKVAMMDLSKDASIIKYGLVIGHAVKDIARGEWVHLHNCASNYDKRSNTLDGDTGAPKDTEYV